MNDILNTPILEEKKKLTWHQQNPERAREIARAWRKANPDKMATYHLRQKEYFKEHPEKQREYSERQRRKNVWRTWAKNSIFFHSRRKELVVTITRDELEFMARATTNCFYCGCELLWSVGEGYRDRTPTLDRLHNEEILTKDNIVICCRQCNTTKTNRSYSEFVVYCEHIVNTHKSRLIAAAAKRPQAASAQPGGLPLQQMPAIGG